MEHVEVPWPWLGSNRGSSDPDPVSKANETGDQTSSRLHGDVAGTLSTRRGHSSQLSISDPSHHVTETIGNLYDEDEDQNSETGRPLSFVTDPAYEDQVSQPHRQHNEKPLQFITASNVVSQSTSDQQTRPRPHVGNGGSKSPSTSLPGHSQRNDQLDEDARPMTSPTLSLRGAHTHTSEQQFPLTNIDNPNDIAQELSNLQALRRLSMDVGNSIDPDIPPMSLAAMPAVAPRGGDDENDPSRLLWVPARVHPELAPTEFKTFLASRLQSIRRRSGDSFLSVPDENSGDEQSPMNSSSLRRKKSLLSRQVDSSDERASEGYANGVMDKPERQGYKNDQPDRDLSLDELVKDPSKAAQRLAQESHSYSGSLESGTDDIPILAVAPSSGLRRSTRTTYRKGGSLRSGDKASFSKRMAQRHQSGDSTDSHAAAAIEPPRGYPLIQVQSEPTENFSRPTRPDRRHDKDSQESSATSTAPDAPSASRSSQFSIRGSSASPRASTDDILTSENPGVSQENRYPDQFSQRHSQTVSTAEEPGLEPVADDPGNNSTGRSNHRSLPGSHKLEDSSSGRLSNSASTQTGAVPLNTSNSNALRTDATITPPAQTRDEKRGDKKARKEKDEDSHNSSRSGSAWKWLKGVADDRDKKKDESKKSRHKATSEKAQDNVRLDVIQSSLEKNATKGRESLVLDRESLDTKLSDERKKDSHRKSDSRKEKDGSLFSSIFGGKKREEKEKNKKHQQLLHVPEDTVPYKPLQPDVDYNWSRFPLLEERAIYRMAHIKLANPRRSLHSQVLLSNFMYSYLAIVQAMHPQMNVPVSPQQKRLEEEARRKREEQEYLAQREAQDEGDEQDQQQSLEQYDFDYHRTTVQYADSNSNQPVEYVDDAQIYEDDHLHDDHGGYGADDGGGYGHEVKDYYRYHHDVSDRHSTQDGVW
ncbi:uncharacterized protein TRIREDRAFT_122838 [Trichoderma reesei QM6a]|uniref:Predicted protein n=2 Tax=Hypocrea jecorina TaxID=51453 RepID=G0RPU7_HYPJQ|nr:uncharacterized protein TRIREDRAFT_122838 [Trichoderma reesei QM6a]EGR46700.1 predicted protein [Trichoderma reesei QM6a]ETS00309.1 hypothetical protein M419DRAFT_83613 [Trichoderma reesei RUT C-30]